MRATTNCPRCGSSQLKPWQAKASLLCPICNHRWEYTQVGDLPRGGQHDYIELSRRGWRKRFYAAYERGDLAEAAQTLDQAPYYLSTAKEPGQAYKLMKQEDRTNTLIKYVVWVLLGLASLKLILYINRPH